MKLFWEKEKNDLCLPYIKELKGRLKCMEGVDKNVAQMIAECAKYVDDDSRSNSKFEPMLTKYIEEHGIEDTANIFSGELRQMPEFFLGEEWTELFCAAVKLMAQWPYPGHYYRRSQRSRKATLHVTDVTRALWAFVQMRAMGLSDGELLNNRKSVPENWLAAKLYTGDQTCVDYVREAMTSENNSKRLEHAHFRAIVKSGHKELLELEGKLLLAARLQKGLRQVIIETCNDGLPESYIYILKVIKDNNLQRFAAVKRGFAVTTGMPGDETPDRINNKLLELVYLYITDRQEAQKAIESDDAMQVYLGLWAIGFYETEKMAESIRRLIDAVPAYKVEAALLMTGNTDNPKLVREVAAKVLSKRSDELGIVAGVLPLYYINKFLYGRIAVCFGKFFNSKEDAEHDFNLLAEVFAKIDKPKTFSPYVFPWHSKELKRSEVAKLLCGIAIFVNTPDIVDRALEYFPSLESFTRYYLVDEMLSKPTTRKQVAFLVEMMTNASSNTRGKACEIVERLFKENKLTADDFRAMEEHLRLKSSEMRMAIVRMFGKLPPQEATDTVRRLLADKVALRRLAGLEIMKNWNEKHERPDAVQALLADVERIAQPSQQEKILIDTIYGNHLEDSALCRGHED